MENIKSLLKEQTEEIKRHMDVLKEGFDSKVSLIAEQYGSIRESLDSHSEMIAKNAEILTSHSVMLTAIKRILR